MFKFLTKSIIATALLKRYQRLLISVAVLFACYFIIGQIHDDFLEYGEKTQNSAAVGFSYVIKWFSLTLATAIFYVFNMYGSEKKKQLKRRGIQAEDLTSAIKNDDQRASDPFENIRRKEKLNSKAEQRLGEKNTRSN
ncbi:hypothetical protein P886_3565 [Alteromonadaceae bacterium 2753L.S.0a.02]|nr:hypothetical protein P886_3565 [Alteromonadaceae bacterium 2753L.S.0a.02]